jgi:hypothetical protein
MRVTIIVRGISEEKKEVEKRLLKWSEFYSLEAPSNLTNRAMNLKEDV